MKKTVFIAIVGRANAGKSSLTNLLVGEKIAIVSAKPQTTRTRINGILTQGDIQYVFIDMPGMHKAKNYLSQAMVKTIQTSIQDIDAAILIIDVTKGFGEIEQRLAEDLKRNQTPTILLLNKVDLVKDKSVLLKLIEKCANSFEFEEIIPISTKDKTNIDKLIPILTRYAKESEFYFPEDLPTDQPEKIWLSEIVREKLLVLMQEEIPHGTAVEIESLEFSTTNKGAEIADIGVVITCEKASHKGMIIGKQGLKLKKIGELARKDMEDYFGIKVNMQIWVRVKEDWRNKPSLVAQFGYESDK